MENIVIKGAKEHNLKNIDITIPKDNPIEYAILYLDGCMQKWIDAEDSLELW